VRSLWESQPETQNNRVDKQHTLINIMTLPTPRKQFSLYPASAPVRILQVDPPRCNATATPRRSTPNRFEASVPKLQLSGKDSCPGSLRSVGSSSVIEDAKYETMVNYLSQQQRSKAWITEASGDGEGVMICRNRGGYLTCPAELGTSLLASYCTSLNISVGNRKLPFWGTCLIYTSRTQ
jgi:hypothetical protein